MVTKKPIIFTKFVLLDAAFCLDTFADKYYNWKLSSYMDSASTYNKIFKSKLVSENVMNCKLNRAHNLINVLIVITNLN